jgi:hypothetical protein
MISRLIFDDRTDMMKYFPFLLAVLVLGCSTKPPETVVDADSVNVELGKDIIFDLKESGNISPFQVQGFDYKCFLWSYHPCLSARQAFGIQNLTM